MLIKYLSLLYFGIYTIYCTLRKYFFNFSGEIYFVYFLDGGYKKNLTIHNLLGIVPEKYIMGNYFVKIIHNDGIKYFSYYGKLSELYDFGNKLGEKTINIVRKNITLTNGNDIVKTDLSILDNYLQNVLCIGQEPDKIQNILDHLNIKCTHLQIIQLRPFKKTVHHISEVHIFDLYHIN